MGEGGTSSMMISCGQGGLSACHLVCQNVLGLPSTALAPWPSSASVSSLSALTNLRVTLSEAEFCAAQGNTTVAMEAAVKLARRAANDLFIAGLVSGNGADFSSGNCGRFPFLLELPMNSRKGAREGHARPTHLAGN